MDGSAAGLGDAGWPPDGRRGDLLIYVPVEVRPMPSEVPLRKVYLRSAARSTADPYYEENLVLERPACRVCIRSLLNI